MNKVNRSRASATSTSSANTASYGESDIDGFYLGRVRIAHRAMRTMIEQAALHIPGVAALARTPHALPALGRPIPWQGIGLVARDGAVLIDLYLLAEHGAQLAQVGEQTQQAVSEAVERLLGLRVSEINVYIQGVV